MEENKEGIGNGTLNQDSMKSGVADTVPPAFQPTGAGGAQGGPQPGYTGYNGGNAQQGQGGPQPGYNTGYGQQAPPPYQNAGPLPSDRQPKKKGPVVAIVAVCVLIVALAAGAVALGVSLFSSPKQKVLKAIAATTADQDHFLAEYLGIEDILKMTAGGKYSSELELYLEEAEDGYTDYSTLSGAGIRAQTSVDYEARKATNDIQIVYNGADLINMELFVDDAVAGVGMPDFYDGYLAFNTETFPEDYNNSYLGESFGTTMEEGIGFNFFDIKPKDNGEAFKLQYADDLKNAYEAIEVNKTDKKRTVSISGKEQDCTGYEVTVPQACVQVVIDDFFEFADNTSEGAEKDYSQIHDFFNEVVDEDLIYMVYLNKKGQMLALEYSYDMTYEGETVECTADLQWAGVNHLWDDFTCFITMTDVETQEVITVQADYDLTREGAEVRQLLNIRANNTQEDETMGAEYRASLNTDSGDTRMRILLDDNEEQVMKIDLQGAFEKVRAGHQYRFNMDSLLFDIEEEASITLSGSYALGGLKESVEIEDDNLRYVFEMDEQDYYDLGEEVQENFMKSPFASLLFGELY